MFVQIIADESCGCVKYAPEYLHGKQQEKKQDEIFFKKYSTMHKDSTLITVTTIRTRKNYTMTAMYESK